MCLETENKTDSVVVVALVWVLALLHFDAQFKESVI